MEPCFCIFQRMSDTHCKYTEYRTQACPLGIHHQKIRICKRQQLSRVFSVVWKNVRNNRDTKVSAKRCLWQKLRNLEFIAFQQSQIQVTWGNCYYLSGCRRWVKGGPKIQRNRELKQVNVVIICTVYGTCKSPKILHEHWDGCNTQEKWKPKVVQNFGGQIRCIVGDVQVACWRKNERGTK